MARKLPWATGAKSVDEAKSKPKQRFTPLRQQLGRFSDRDSDAPTLVQRQRTQNLKQDGNATSKVARERSLSSSPPPAPPTVEFMREDGQDDAWIMVEDEFMSTAHKFTRHLHHAAYKERKAEAARRLAASTNDHAELSATKVLNQTLISGEATPLERADSDEAEDEDDFLWSDKRLARLMLGHKIKGSSGRLLHPLPSRLGSELKSRALAESDKLTPSSTGKAGQFKPAQTRPEQRQYDDQDGSETQESTDDDDLDAFSKISSSPPVSRIPDLKPTNHAAKTGMGSSTPVEPVQNARATAIEDKPQSSPSAPPPPKSLEEGDDGGFPARRRIGSRLAEWRARRAKRLKLDEEGEEQQKVKEEIPLFLT